MMIYGVDNSSFVAVADGDDPHRVQLSSVPMGVRGLRFRVERCVGSGRRSQEETPAGSIDWTIRWTQLHIGIFNCELE